MPTMPFMTIISTENRVSLAKVGLFSPVNMMAAIMMTSILITEMVSIIVP